MIEQPRPGMRVVRDPAHWTWKDQDCIGSSFSSHPSVGTITTRDNVNINLEMCNRHGMPPGYNLGHPIESWNKWWWVEWDGGSSNVYPPWSLNEVLTPSLAPVAAPVKEFEEV